MLDLTRTRVAIAAHQIEEKRFVAGGDRNAGDETMLRLLRSLEAAEVAVGHAFALDTADRNRYELAATMRPGDPWLTALLATH